MERLERFNYSLFSRSLVKYYLIILLLFLSFVSQGATITQTTPGSYSYTVPAGVYSLYITMSGGAGGGGGADSSTGGTGGNGQLATGYLVVSPGQVFTLIVGGGGGGGWSGAWGKGGGTKGASAYGAGGVGGATGTVGTSGAGGGGGGASAIRLGASVIMVAGGGAGGVGGAYGQGTLPPGLAGGNQIAGSGSTAGAAGTNRGAFDGGGAGGGGGGYVGGASGNPSRDAVSPGSSSSGGTGYLTPSVIVGALTTGGGAIGGVGTSNSGGTFFGSPGGDGSITIVENMSISGQVTLDSLGTASASGSGISAVTVNLYDSDGVFLATTTTNSSGNYNFANLTPSLTYYVAVYAPTGGNGPGSIAEQTYASSGNNNVGTAGLSGYGPICVGGPPKYFQRASTKTSLWNTRAGSGPCYGGRQGSVADSPVTTAISNEHVTRVQTGSSIWVTGVNFAFSYNVVTNTNDSGQGSLRQFIINANAGSGSNVMRFVPTITPNADNGSNAWWKTALTSTGLPMVTASNVTIDGTAYSSADGTTVLATNSYIMQAATSVGYGSSATTIGPVNGAMLEINAPGTATYSPVMGTNAARTTIQNIAITGGYNFGIWAGSGSSSFLLQNSAIGIDPGGTNSLNTYGAAYGGALRIGDASNSSTTSGISGTIQNNVINSNSNNIYMYGVSGLTSGQYVIRKNFLLGTGTANTNSVNINSSPNTQFLSNYVTSGAASNLYVENSSDGVTVTGNTILASNNGSNVNIYSNNRAQVIGNIIQSGFSYGIRSHTSPNALYQKNLITNNGKGGLAIVNTNANQVTQNIYGNNTGNAIDLNGDGVTTNNSDCINGGWMYSANTGVARPVIKSASLSGSTLMLSGTMCNIGTFTIEIYQSAGTGTANGMPNNDMGEDNQLAGEGTVYLGSLVATNGVFSGSLTVSGLTIGSSTISATAIRTSGNVLGDTSEFAANFTVQNPNFGSAPDSYKTLRASGGPQHYIYSGLSLGAVVSESPDGNPVTTYNPAAGGDAITALPFPQLTLDTTTYSVTINATNLGPNAAKIVGWIDFNRNGTFEASEGVAVSVPANTNNGSFTLTWSNVQSLLNLTNRSQGIGPTYARFRLSTSSTLTTSTPDGLLSDGEVEDYGGTGVLTIIGQDILGTVFNDVNQNGMLDNGESGTGLTLYAKQVRYNGSSCVGPAIQAVAVDPTSGGYHLVGVAPETWCVVISNDNTLSNVTPYTPSGWSYTLNNPGKLLVTVTASANQGGENFGLSNQMQMQGTVFYDTGSGGGIAYNGTQDGSETGVAKAKVQISYGSGQTATTITNSAGAFSLNMPVTTGAVTFSVILPSGTVSVSKGTLGYTDSASPTAYNSITLNAATVAVASNNRIRFGLAPKVTLEQSTIEAGSPGRVVFHPHTFNAHAPGVVTFSYNNQTAFPGNVPWPVMLYRDVNCSGVFSSNNTVINGPLTVTLGQTVCVLTKIQIPPGNSVGHLHTQNLHANFVYQSGGFVTVTTSNLDVSETTNVGNQQQLQLVKSVDKTTAQPGDVLTYTITYLNRDIKEISHIVINDSTAAYTRYVTGSAVCVAPLPTGMTCTVNTNLDGNNQGSVSWTFSGSLRSGASGSVTYQVMVH